MNEAMTTQDPSGEIVVYEAPGGAVRVNVQLKQETVWLTQRQMAEVFDTSADNVALHLKNIYDDGELASEATIKDCLVVQTEGERQVRRSLKHYNLDAIISVGYRVNSKRGVNFRQWATRTLREHFVSGYTLHEQRLTELGLSEAYETINLLARTLRNRALIDNTGEAILNLVVGYADTWRLLLEYDENRLGNPAGTRPAESILDTERALDAIKVLKHNLETRGETSSLFGNQHGDGLEAILGNIEQTMFGDPLYRSREEKAAHLLYFVVKDHPFTDGNKRIGAFLFLLYLSRESITHQINSSTLTALTLLIAESTPSNKDLMVRLIVNLLLPPSQ